MPIETQDVIRHLKEKEGKEGKLPELLKFYQRLLGVQSEVEQKLASLLEPTLSSEAINKRIEHGLSLIRFDELALDWSLLTDTFTKVTAIFADYPELFGELPKRLKEPGASQLLTREAVEAWFEGAELPKTFVIDDVNENLLAAIIHG